MVSEDLFLINLKNYRPTNFSKGATSVWSKVPVTRRSSVFILLFLGRMGELRVILTKRSSKLRNFPGHISLPGGKADSPAETEWQVSRREMEEEIGLSANNDELRKEYGFEIEHLNTLPCYLSRTFSAVKPCIGFMNYNLPRTLKKGGNPDGLSGDVEEHLEEDLTKTIQMNLNPGESSSIFSCPLRDFLYPAYGVEENNAKEAIDRSSIKVEWGRIPWNLRSYTFSQNNPNEVAWLKDIKDLSESESEVEDSPSPSPPLGSSASVSTPTGQEQAQAQELKELRESKKNKLKEWGRLGSRRDSLTNERIYDVWGLTANILHDLAQIAYNSQPETEKREISRELGEEELIYSLWKHGNQMQRKERSVEESKLISSTSARDELGFHDVLPRTEFNRLKKLYSKE